MEAAHDTTQTAAHSSMKPLSDQELRMVEHVEQTLTKGLELFDKAKYAECKEFYIAAVDKLCSQHADLPQQSLEELRAAKQAAEGSSLFTTNQGKCQQLRLALEHALQSEVRGPASEFEMNFERDPELAKTWLTLDDPVMGGASQSAIATVGPAEQVEFPFRGALWHGRLVTEGGGFATVRSPSMLVNLSVFKGIEVCVVGDGRRYKVNLKQSYDGRSPVAWYLPMTGAESILYQADFDTEQDKETVARLPFASFLPMWRGMIVRPVREIDTSRISMVGLMLSKLNADNSQNPRCEPGMFRLYVRYIRAYAE